MHSNKISENNGEKESNHQVKCTKKYNNFEKKYNNFEKKYNNFEKKIK